jgi:hypothetical protein
LARAADLAVGDTLPGFVAGFPSAARISEIYGEVYTDVHRRWIDARRAGWASARA